MNICYNEIKKKLHKGGIYGREADKKADG